MDGHSPPPPHLSFSLGNWRGRGRKVDRTDMDERNCTAILIGAALCSSLVWFLIGSTFKVTVQGWIFFVTLFLRSFLFI